MNVLVNIMLIINWYIDIVLMLVYIIYRCLSI